MEKKLYIIGAGSVGGHIALNIEGYDSDYKVEGFFDDDPQKARSPQFGYPVLGTVDKVLKMEDAHVVIGIAFPGIKEKISTKLSKNKSLVYPSFVHSRAWISEGVSVGIGCVIYPGCSVNYGSKIDDFVIMNMNCALGHHTEIGGFSSLAPSVSTGGHTVIGEAVDVGIGVSTIQNVRVGKNCTIGGQTMLVRDVKSNSKVVGVPGKNIA